MPVGTLEFEDRAAYAMNALCAHGTYGIGARCGVVNTNSVPGNWPLPTTWFSTFEQESEDHQVYPMFEVFTRGVQDADPIIVGTNVFKVRMVVRFWLDAAYTTSSPVKSAKLYRMLSWAIMRMLIENSARSGGQWSGRTLLGLVANLEDINIVPAKRLHGMTVAGIGAELTCTVTVEEEDVET